MSWQLESAPNAHSSGTPALRAVKIALSQIVVGQARTVARPLGKRQNCAVDHIRLAK
jgi:hypothetical protein